VTKGLRDLCRNHTRAAILFTQSSKRSETQAGSKANLCYPCTIDFILKPVDPEKLATKIEKLTGDPKVGVYR
jgi:two-component SAPR family response regulator